MRIDKKNKKILELMEKNSRISLQNLAKKIATSPQTAHHRINRLISEKVILNFPTIIDYAYFGLTEIKVYFKILYTSSKVLNEIIGYFKNHDFVAEVIECGGNRDIIITYSVKNLSQFNKIIHEDIERFQRHLEVAIILFSVVHHILDHNIIIGGDREPVVFKKKIKKLLYLFSINSKVTITKLTQQLKMDPKTIIKLISSLKKDNVIKAYTANINKTILDKIVYKVLVRYSSSSIAREKEFLNFIKKQKSIQFFTKVIGRFNVELEIEIDKTIELRKLIFEIREMFSDIIQDMDEIPIYHLHKRTCLPKMILKN